MFANKKSSDGNFSSSNEEPGWKQGLNMTKELHAIILQLKKLKLEIVTTIKGKETLNELKRKSNSIGTVNKTRQCKTSTNDANDDDTRYRKCSIYKKCHSRVYLLASKNKYRGGSRKDTPRKEKGCLTTILKK